MCGNAEEAVRLGYEVVAEARSQGRPGGLAVAMANLCSALIVVGDLAAACRLAPEAIELAWHNDRLGYIVDHLSSLAAQTGRFEDALQLIGFTDAWWARVQYRREGNEAAAVARASALSEAALGPVEAARCRELGTRLAAEEVKRLALACVEPAVREKRAARRRDRRN